MNAAVFCTEYHETTSEFVSESLASSV